MAIVSSIKTSFNGLILFVVLTSIFYALTLEMENSANVNSNIKTIFLSFIIITFFNVN